jgi:hypothetical protein
MLALLLLLGDPLQDLSSDDIEVRQAAAAVLYARGPEALLDARRRATDVEACARLDDLLRRRDVEERIRGFGGGNRVGGFGVSVRSDRFSGRGPFRLTVEVMNLAPSSQVFPGLGAWDLERPDEETRTHGADARVSVRKFAGGGLRRTRWGSASGSAAQPVALRRGESTTYVYPLDLKGLPAGDYEVRVEVLALPDAEEPLRSNVVRLMLRP